METNAACEIAKTMVIKLIESGKVPPPQPATSEDKAVTEGKITASYLKTVFAELKRSLETL